MNLKIFFTKIPRVYTKWLVIILASLFLLTGIGLIFVLQKREDLLASAIEKAKLKAKHSYQLDLRIQKAGFSGLRSVLVEGVEVIPENGDRLADVKHLEVSVKLWPLLSGKIKILEVNLNNAHVSFVKKDSLSNYDFFFKKNQDSTMRTGGKESMDLANLSNRLINSVLHKIPDDMELKNVRFSYTDDSIAQNIQVPQADIVNGKLNSTILVNKDESIWHLQGTLNPNRKKVYLKLFADGKKVELPLIEEKYGLKLSFDTLETNLENVTWKTNEDLLLEGTLKLSNLLVNHWRIASNDVVVSNAFLDSKVLIGKDFLSVDEGSRIKIAKMTLYPQAKVTLGEFKTYSLRIIGSEYLDAQDVFDSLPRGLFESLEGIRVAGKMKYDLDFFLDAASPDSVKLESVLVGDGFDVNAWGKTDLTKINSTFTYIPYEDGKAGRAIIVGPANPNFVPLNQISPYLRNAILTAEDPSFFSHQGFVPQAIRSSIAVNFKEKRFKRGGSTISMQLVKNVYLDREKTLARKIEEMLIVWLIEEHRLVSKERMYEVYLNVIEWGRNVYGIGEASQYYFQKSPSQLNLGEGIFLASIVPRPKSGLYRFDYTGHLKPYITGYYGLIGDLMAQRGYTSSDSTRAYGFYDVSVREALRPAAPQIDSVMVDIDDDSNFLEEEINGVKRMLNNLFKKKEDKEVIE